MSHPHVFLSWPFDLAINTGVFTTRQVMERLEVVCYATCSRRWVDPGAVPGARSWVPGAFDKSSCTVRTVLTSPVRSWPIADARRANPVCQC